MSNEVGAIPDAGMTAGSLRVNFIALWAVLLAAKFILAASLPLFVDEAFYAWEGRFPAWAYSDLPGMTAFLTRLASALGGEHLLGLRWIFVLVGSSVPWLVVGISRRWFGARAGWWAGLFCLLMPLSGLLGVLALPDVPMVFAAMLCLYAVASLRERPSMVAAFALALALVVGGLSHYRFALVVLAGLSGLLMDRRGRDLLRTPVVLAALVAGGLAWVPLLLWNIENAGAGLRFQVVERNPWAFHADGAAWLPIQFLLVTPLLFLLLSATLREAWRRRRDAATASPWPLLAGVATVSVLGYFLLGFFVDDQRVSFHWPLSGWLALAAAAPVVFQRWRPGARIALLAVAFAGLCSGLAFLAVASYAPWRSALAASPIYPVDFAGWPELSDAARKLRLGDARVLIASDFELAAQLVHALDRRDVRVLDSPLNHKHGRAAQLRAWGLQLDRVESPVRQRTVLVVDDTATPMKLRLQRSQRICRLFGQLPLASVVTADHGRKRYLVYRIEPGTSASPCASPALAWIDRPLPGATSASTFTIEGWAFKDGVGLSRVDVTIDGKFAGRATYGRAMPNVAGYWKGSTDPNQPRVGFSAQVDATALAPGKHWLGLLLHGADGSVEPWPEQLIRIAR